MPARVNLACVKATEEQDLPEDRRRTRELFSFRFSSAEKFFPRKMISIEINLKWVFSWETERSRFFLHKYSSHLYSVLLIDHYTRVLENYPTNRRQKERLPLTRSFPFHYFDFVKMIRGCPWLSISNRSRFICRSSTRRSVSFFCPWKRSAFLIPVSSVIRTCRCPVWLIRGFYSEEISNHFPGQFMQVIAEQRNSAEKEWHLMNTSN